MGQTLIIGLVAALVVILTFISTWDKNASDSKKLASIVLLIIALGGTYFTSYFSYNDSKKQNKIDGLIVTNDSLTRLQMDTLRLNLNSSMENSRLQKQALDSAAKLILSQTEIIAKQRELNNKQAGILEKQINLGSKQEQLDSAYKTISKLQDDKMNLVLGETNSPKVYLVVNTSVPFGNKFFPEIDTLPNFMVIDIWVRNESKYFLKDVSTSVYFDDYSKPNYWIKYLHSNDSALATHSIHKDNNTSYLKPGNEFPLCRIVAPQNKIEYLFGISVSWNNGQFAGSIKLTPEIAELKSDKKFCLKAVFDLTSETAVKKPVEYDFKCINFSSPNCFFREL